MALLQRPSTSIMADTDSKEASPATQLPPQPPLEQASSIFSARSLRQSSLFFAGATFLTLSTLLTRRTITRRRLSTLPKYYHASNSPPTTPINGPFEALEALNLATLNVSAFGIMMVGGMGWALDVSNLEDLRRRVRGGMGVDGTGRGEREVEEEFEEWLATTLERKSEKEERRRRSRERERREGLQVEEEEGSERKLTNERGKER